MAVEDDNCEGSTASGLLASADSRQNEDRLTAEDLAWIDSCLIKDSETLESNWDSLKDALLGVLSSQPELVYQSATVSDYYHVQDDMETLPSSEQLGGKLTESPPRSIEDLISMDKEETDDECSSYDDITPLQRSLRNAFQPNYSEIPVERTNLDVGSDEEANETEFSSGDIFKVWDLGVQDDEDDFAKQLTKALAGSSDDPSPSEFGSSVAWGEDSKDDLLENLVAGIADLSLKQDS